MLAHKYSEQGHKIKFPALVQPKLDGHRCTSQLDDINEVSLWSRTRKPITSVPHIQRAIEKFFPIIQHTFGDIIINRFDGELYNHDYHKDFEELSSVIRSEKSIDENQIMQYHIYDIPYPTMTNKERNELLQSLKPKFEGTPLHIVETLIVNDEDELMLAFDHFIAQGYEGCIVRNMDGKYVNKRSYDLQKVKEFDDDEFEIIGVNTGKGKMSDKAIFLCDIPALHGKTDDPTFEAKMKGKLDDLKQYVDNPSLAIGRMLTVQYQGYTKYGKPRFPVGLRFREDI